MPRHLRLRIWLLTGTEVSALCAIPGLAMAAKDENYGYIFATVKVLCDVLALKNDIGIRTRREYQAKNREAIRELIQEYTVIAERLEIFYQAFQKQWFAENKPFGFEVQDLRIGGLLQRTKSCTARLKAFADGTLDEIAELDGKILDPECGDGTVRELQCNQWKDYFLSVL